MTVQGFIQSWFCGRELKFHLTQGHDDTFYFMVGKSEAFNVLALARRLVEVFGARPLDVNGNEIATDGDIFVSTDLRFDDCVVLLCDLNVHGQWVTKRKYAPITKIFPSLDYGGPFRDFKFSPMSPVFCSDGVPNIISELSGVEPNAVDVVYTWVDSDDPSWQDRKLKAVGSKSAVRSADNKLRYLSRDELRFSLRSVRKFAPWVRNIFIVTDQQRPDWLNEHPKVRVVDHREIFPSADFLPTFNSHAIEACLHRIEGLSEHFIYFNDDVFLGRHVSRDKFFDVNGWSRVYASPASFIDPSIPYSMRVPTDHAAYLMQDIFARDFNFLPVRKLMHTPHPLRRSILQEIETRYSKEIQRTRLARIRSPGDLAIPSMFYHYFAFATGRASLRKTGETKYTYLDTGKVDFVEKLNALVKSPPHFFCLNATYFQEVSLNDQANMLSDALSKLFPKPAPWER